MVNNTGKVFEKEIKDSCKDLMYIRLVDSNKWTADANTSFTVKNPCDIVLYRSPFIYPIELKTTIGDRMSYNGAYPFEKSDSHFAIAPHQVKALKDFSVYEGSVPGLLVRFEKYTMDAFFIHISTFLDYALKSPKSSLTYIDVKRIGIIIPSTLKRVYYRYDMSYLPERWQPC